MRDGSEREKEREWERGREREREREGERGSGRERGRERRGRGRGEGEGEGVRERGSKRSQYATLSVSFINQCSCSYSDWDSLCAHKKAMNWRIKAKN